MKSYNLFFVTTRIKKTHTVFWLIIAPFMCWLGRCQYNVTGRDRSHGLPALSRVWQFLNCQTSVFGTRPRYSLVVDEDVKKPNKQVPFIFAN